MSLDVGGRRRPAVVHPGWWERLDGALNAWVDYRALVPLRIAAGGLALLHLAPVLAAAWGGTTYRDAFHIPAAGWFPELPDVLYIGLMWLTGVAAVALAFGFRTRPAAIVLATGFGYHLFVTPTHYHHNRAFLFVILVGLTLMPVGDDLALDTIGKDQAAARGCAPQWPLLLLRFQLAAVYAASGVSKLLDPDWWGGTVLRLRVTEQVDVALAAGVPAQVVELAGSAGFQWWFSKLVIATEVFIGVGLLWRRTRWVAVWLAIAFHLAIEVTAAVQLFSYAGIAALVVWVDPRRRTRTLVAPAPWLRLVRALDWTGRLSLEDGPRWRLEDRNGRTWRGTAARGRAATLLPLTFFVAAPVAALVSRSRRWSSARRGGTVPELPPRRAR